MKIVWGLLERPDELWAKVLIFKYLKKTPAGLVLARKSGFSAIWRGLLKVWPSVSNGLHWSVRDGCSTRFWMDRWVDSGAILIDHATNIQGVNPSLLVSEVCSINGAWNSDFLFLSFPER